MSCVALGAKPPPLADALPRPPSRTSAQARVKGAPTRGAVCSTYPRLLRYDAGLSLDITVIRPPQAPAEGHSEAGAGSRGYSVGPSSCPYSAECVEEEFSEVRLCASGPRFLTTEAGGPLLYPPTTKNEPTSFLRSRPVRLVIDATTFLQKVCASGHYVSHRTDNGVLICDALCKRSNLGPPLPPPGGLGLDFVSLSFSARLWRVSRSLSLVGGGFLRGLPLLYSPECVEGEFSEVRLLRGHALRCG